MSMKKIWSGIREIVNIRNSKPHQIAQLKVDWKIISKWKDNSNKFNEFFVNVGPTTESEIPKSQDVSTLKFMKQRNQFEFLIADVSHEELLNIIKSLEN